MISIMYIFCSKRNLIVHFLSLSMLINLRAAGWLKRSILLFGCNFGENFFRDKKVGFPKYKSAKYARKRYTTNNQKGSVQVLDDGVKLPKVDIVKAKIHRQAKEDWMVKSATVSKERDGTFYVSILYEFTAKIQSVPVSENVMGLDYKSDGLYTDSNGEVCGSPKYYRKAQKKLAKLQRQLSRKKERV